MDIKVFIIDDQKLFVEGLKQILNSFDEIEIVGEAYRGDNIEDNMLIYSADMVFLDLNLPGKNGIEVLEWLKKNRPKLKIVILSMYADLMLAKKCRQLGANAYLTKDADINELKKVIFDLDAGEFYFSKLINKQIEVEKVREDKFEVVALFSTREKEIISLIVQGYSNQEIGEKLFISPSTVHTHRKNIFNKLKINKVQELVKYAIENGIS